MKKISILKTNKYKSPTCVFFFLTLKNCYPSDFLSILPTHSNNNTSILSCFKYSRFLCVFWGFPKIWFFFYEIMQTIERWLLQKMFRPKLLKQSKISRSLTHDFRRWFLPESRRCLRSRSKFLDITILNMFSDFVEFPKSLKIIYETDIND